MVACVNVGGKLTEVTEISWIVLSDICYKLFSKFSQFTHYHLQESEDIKNNDIQDGSTNRVGFIMEF